MNEKHTELLSRLVTGHKRDGRCEYDPDAKLELIRSCLKPGVSVARTAMQHGINPNLLRNWVTRYQKQSAAALAPESGTKAEPAFTAVQVTTDISSDLTEAPARPPAIAAPVTPLSPVVQAGTRESALAIRLHVRLPNGVELNLGEASLEELSSVMHMLGRLPCSDSTTR